MNFLCIKAMEAFRKDAERQGYNNARSEKNDKIKHTKN